MITGMPLFDEIAQERSRQEAKWGHQKHPHHMWHYILNEELGEAVKLDLDAMEDPKRNRKSEWPPIRQELIQAVAVLIAWIQDYDEKYGDI